jgi:hypothetical protein
MSRKTARRAQPADTTGKELVPVKDTMWDEEVADILRQLITFNRRKADGHKYSATMRTVLATESALRLEQLVARMDARLGVPAP